MKPWLLVGFGGFFGAVGRYLFSGIVQTRFNEFPAGTLAVNFLGSFLLGLSMYGAEFRGYLTQDTRIFLTIGILGAFTTMSTFQYESFKLLENGQNWLVILNLVANVFLGFFAIYLGRLIILLFN